MTSGTLRCFIFFLRSLCLCNRAPAAAAGSGGPAGCTGENSYCSHCSRDRKHSRAETEARLLSLHQGTQVFPHSPNQHPSLRGQGQQTVALPSSIPDSPLQNHTIQSQIPTRNPEVTDWELTTGAGSTQRGGQEWCVLSRRADASSKNCI